MSRVIEFLEYLVNNENPQNLKYLSQGTILGLLLFILYLEVNPKLGNIWFRYSDQGKRILQPDALVQYLRHPFTSSLFWKPENWDLNFVVFSGMTSALYTLVRNGIDFFDSQ